MKEERQADKLLSGDKIELYSRGSTGEMLGDMPNWLIHTGSYIVYGLIVVLLAGGAIFRYPDVVTAHVSIDDYSKVEWITANQDGNLKKIIAFVLVGWCIVGFLKGENKKNKKNVFIRIVFLLL